MQIVEVVERDNRRTTSPVSASGVFERRHADEAVERAGTRAHADPCFGRGAELAAEFERRGPASHAVFDLQIAAVVVKTEVEAVVAQLRLDEPASVCAERLVQLVREQRSITDADPSERHSPPRVLSSVAVNATPRL